MPSRKKRPGKFGTTGAVSTGDASAWDTVLAFAKRRHLSVSEADGGFHVETSAYSANSFRCAFLVFHKKLRKWSVTHNLHPGEALEFYRHDTPEQAWDFYTQ